MHEAPLVIRTDATVSMGTGHLMRCLALAQGWRASGGRVTFVVNCALATLLRRVRQEGFEVIELSNESVATPEQRIPMHVLQRFPNSWIVLDGYHFTTADQQQIKESGQRLLVIDDLGHLPHYKADLVLNQNLHASLMRYGHEATTRLLLGPQYALLRNEFLSGQREQCAFHKPSKLLVTLGGSDPVNQTERVIAALAHLAPTQFAAKIQVRVIMGGSNPHLSEIQTAAAMSPIAVELIVDANDMARQMAWADVAISAGGSTCWELAYMGIPNIIIVLAENQRPIATQIDRLGAGIYLGDWAQVTTAQIADAVQGLFHATDKLHDMRARTQQLVDGKGVERVVQAMVDDMVARVNTPQDSALSLRPAFLGDAELLWQWVNEPAVRRGSFHSEEIPWEDHIAWFWRKLNDPNTFIYVASNGAGAPLAQVRFEVVVNPNGQKMATISISVDVAMRSKGIGRRVIALACSQLWREQDVAQIYAYIRPTNQASIRSFLASGFIGFDNLISYAGQAAVVGLLKRPAENGYG